ncbi:MAG: hypothetical protein DMG27_20610 [Acidobacteria bacterium]|nr:MAG: hypothetical protein DMG27_20610 [Acidobacteriota bacterium]
MIGLYDESDDLHSRAAAHFSTYFGQIPNQMIVAWPILYESISTKMVRQRKNFEALDKGWRALRAHGQLLLLDDQEFRESAMDECLAEVSRPPRHYRALSLTDRVLRGVLASADTRVDLFITFNPQDFVDVCRQVGRRMVS